MTFKKCSLVAVAGLFLALPAYALTAKDFKPYFGEFGSYSSHVRHGDIALLAVDDEGAQFAYIVNLKTKQKFRLVYGSAQPSGNTELIFFSDGGEGQPEASGIRVHDLKDIEVEFRYSSGSCERYTLAWSPRHNGYLLSNQGRGRCVIKTVR